MNKLWVLAVLLLSLYSCINYRGLRSKEQVVPADSVAQPMKASDKSPTTYKDTSAIDSAKKLLLQTCDNYLQVNPQGVKSLDVYSIKASVFYNDSFFAHARDLYQQIITSFPTDVRKTEAVRMVAQTYYEEKNYEKAQEWYRKFKNQVPAGSNQKEAVGKIAESIFRIAESLESAGKFSEAAAEFERVYLEFPETKIADISLFNAALAYEKMEDFQKASQLLQTITQKYEDSKMIPRAMFLLAKIEQKKQQFDKAADLFLRVVAQYPQDDIAVEALYSAGLSFESADKLREAAAVFEKFAELFPNDENVADVLFRSGELFGEAKDWTSVKRVNYTFMKKFGDDINRKVQAECMVGIALYMEGKTSQAISQLMQTVKTYKSLKEPSAINSFYAAKADYTIGEIYHDSMKTIPLVSQKRLYRKALGKKSALMDQALEHYFKVVRYAITEWTTRGIFQLGKVYEDFALGVFKQQRDPSLSIDEQLSLELGIAQVLDEFLVEKALDFHEKNVMLAIKEQINNTYVDESRKKLTQLPFVAAETYLALADIAVKANQSVGSKQLALIQEKLISLQKIAPFKKRAIELLLLCLEKSVAFVEESQITEKAKGIVTKISYDLANTYADVVDIARSAPIPQGFNSYERFIYKTKLLQQTREYQAQSIKNFIRTLDIAETYDIQDIIVQQVQKRTAEMLFAQARSYDLLFVEATKVPPLPDEADQQQQEEYYQQFEQVAQKFLDEAVSLYQSILDFHQRGFVDGDYVKHTYVRLYQLFPQKYGVEKVQRDTLTLGTDSTWQVYTQVSTCWRDLVCSLSTELRPVFVEEISKQEKTLLAPLEVPALVIPRIRGDSCYIRKSFFNNQTVTDAVLSVYSETPVRVYLNGEPVNVGPKYQMQKYTLTGTIREGNNVIAMASEAKRQRIKALLQLVIVHKNLVAQVPGTQTVLHPQFISEKSYVFPKIPHFEFLVKEEHSHGSE